MKPSKRHYFKNTPVWVAMLSTVVAIQLLATAKPILVNDGSHFYRYVAKQIDLEQVDDEAASRALDAIISGTAANDDFARLNSTEAEPDQSRQEINRAP